MVIAADDVAADHGLEPLAVVRSWASVGVPPEDTGLAPTIGIPKALTRAGLSIDDIDLWEINEAFDSMRSEEHTSELQSLMRISYAVFCLKKKKKQNNTTTNKKSDVASKYNIES